MENIVSFLQSELFFPVTVRVLIVGGLIVKMIYDFLREKLFISASIGVVWLAFVLIVNYTEWREVDITDMPISG